MIIPIIKLIFTLNYSNDWLTLVSKSNFFIINTTADTVPLIMALDFKNKYVQHIQNQSMLMEQIMNCKEQSYRENESTSVSFLLISIFRHPKLT